MPSKDASSGSEGPTQNQASKKTRKTLHIRMWRVEKLANDINALIERGPGEGLVGYTNGEVYLAFGLATAAEEAGEASA